jgi:hypothetical protein
LEVSSTQLELAPEPSKKSLSSSCVEDAVLAVLGIWKLLIEKGVSESVIEKLMKFMCEEIENLNRAGTLFFEILGDDEKDDGVWMIILECEKARTAVSVRGLMYLYFKNPNRLD